MAEQRKALLSVQDLQVHYPVKIRNKGFFAQKRVVRAVDGVSFDVYEGETLGIVGESGCGKSTTGRAIVRLNRPTGGKIFYDGQDLYNFPKQEQGRLSREIQIIFQDPYSSLDPRFTVGRTIAEPLVVHGEGDHAQRYRRVVELMEEVGLREELYSRYPHEFSGGQRQRIVIARALVLNPEFVVCDEPVSALDVSVRSQVLNLIKELQAHKDLTYMFISHDLSVVKYVSDRIAVMYLGRVVEIAEKEEFYAHPLHPYTQALLSAIPIPDVDVSTKRIILEGDVPSPLKPPSGCHFHTRCRYATEQCRQCRPPLREEAPGHYVACHLYDKEGV